MRKPSAWLALSFLILIALQGMATPGKAAPGKVTPKAPTSHPREARNVVFFVADGLGPTELTVAHLLKGDRLVMETGSETGLSSVQSLDNAAPDAAAAATALATGHRTRNDMVSIDPSGAHLLTLLEAAHKAGRATGLVSNLPVTHASIAPFAAHANSHQEDLSVAEQYMKAAPEVILGGGRSFFLPVSKDGKRTDEKNLLEETKSVGYTQVGTAAELKAAKGPGKLIGLFSSSAMSYEIDRSGAEVAEPSLSEMTAKALEFLSTANGFVLVVNAGHLDYAGHDHDSASLLREVSALDDAVGVAVDFAKAHPDTLVVVAGSHETGGLALTPGFKAEVVRASRASLEKVARAVRQDRSKYEVTLSTLLGWLELKTDEKEGLVLASDAAHKPTGTGSDPLVVALAHIMENRSGLTWATFEHTGEPCPIFAWGAGSEHFAGFMDNTEVARRIAQSAGLQLP